MKQNKSSRSTVLLFLLGAALIVAALIMLVPDLLNYKQSNDTYEALKENYISEKAENTEVAEETEGDDSWWYTDVDVKLEELQQVNADIIGWIRFDNLEQLSYPVLYEVTAVAILASSISTCFNILVSGLSVVSHNCSGSISPSPLYLCRVNVPLA